MDSNGDIIVLPSHDIAIIDNKDVIALFTSGTIKTGTHIIDNSFFALSRSEMIKILVSGYYPFTNDLSILTFALKGTECSTLKKRIHAMKMFVLGKTLHFENDLFLGSDIGIIRLSTSDPTFIGIGIPLVLVHVGDDMWAGMIQCKCRIARIEFWVYTYYSYVLHHISYMPTNETFLHDFRQVSVYVPEKTKFVSKRVFLADRRSIVDIKHDCIRIFNKKIHLEDITSKVSALISSNERISLTESSISLRDTAIVTNPSIHENIITSSNKNNTPLRKSPRRTKRSEGDDAERSPKRQKTHSQNNVEYASR